MNVRDKTLDKVYVRKKGGDAREKKKQKAGFEKGYMMRKRKGYYVGF